VKKKKNVKKMTMKKKKKRKKKVRVGTPKIHFHQKTKRYLNS